MADHRSISIIPVAVTHSAPHAIIAGFHTTFINTTDAHKPDLSMSAHCNNKYYVICTLDILGVILHGFSHYCFISGYIIS